MDWQPPLPPGYRLLFAELSGLLSDPPALPWLGSGMQQVGIAVAMGELDATSGTTGYLLLLLAPETPAAAPAPAGAENR